MIDQKRRTLMTAISAAAAITAVPVIASPLTASTETVVPIRGTGIDVSFTGSGSATRVTVTNTTGSDVSLKHVYPGIVHADGKTYDINSILANQPLMIRPGRSRSLGIQEVAGNMAAQVMPSNLAQGKSLTVQTSYNVHGSRQHVKTLRSYLA